MSDENGGKTPFDGDYDFKVFLYAVGCGIAVIAGIVIVIVVVEVLARIKLP
jgi:hypothetical protein